MKRKVFAAILIILIVVSGGIGLYYQRYIPQTHIIPMQTTIGYIIAGICFFILSYFIEDKQKSLKTFCRILGIVNVVGSAAFALIF